MESILERRENGAVFARPPVSGLRLHSMNEVKQIQVADGADVCFVTTDRFKTGEVHVTMALPLDGDIAAKAVLPYILRRSCAKYPDFSSLNGYLDELYGASLFAGVEKLGEAQLIKMGVGAIDDRFALDGESVAESAVGLLFDLLFDPKLENGTFTQADVDIEKRLLAERMMGELDDKRVYALRRCQELMCADEAFGKNRFGTLPEIESLTPERVFAAWRGALENAVVRIVVVGSGDAEKIAGMLRARFAGIRRSPLKTETSFVGSAAQPKYFSEEQPVKQGKLVMGLRVGMNKKEDCRPAMTVMSDILGGGTYSKLFMNVREKMSLCYYCSARLIKEKGVLMIQSGIETKNEEKARAAILAQLEAMRSGDFGEETLAASLLSLNETLQACGDSPGELSAWYSAQILDDTLKTPEDRAAELNAVTRGEVAQAANGVTLDTVFMLIGTEADGDED